MSQEGTSQIYPNPLPNDWIGYLQPFHFSSICQTLSVTIRNFWASAELWESAQLRPGGEWVMVTGERLKDFYQIPIRLASMACFQVFFL